VSEVRRRRVDPAGYCFSDQLSDVGKLDHLPHTILKSAMIPQAYIIVEDDAIDQDEIEFVSEVGTCKSMCFQSKFWVSSDDESEEDFPTPSNASLLRRAENAGFQADDLVQAVVLLQNSDIKAQVTATSTPATISDSAMHVRKLMSALIKSRSTVQPWQGPLLPPRISPSVTLGDCVTHDARIRNKTTLKKFYSNVSDRAPKSSQIDKGDFVSSKSRPDQHLSKEINEGNFQGSRFGQHKVMAIRFANNDWARVHLCTSVGNVLRHRGKLSSLGSPSNHRGSNLPLTSYADVVRRGLMEGGGAGQGSAGGFGGAMLGAGRGLGVETNPGRPQVAPQMMFGRGAGSSGINFGGAPLQQVFGAPQFGVPAALVNHQFGVPQGQFARQGQSVGIFPLGGSTDCDGSIGVIFQQHNVNRLVAGSSSHHMHQQQSYFHQQQHGSVVDHHQAAFQPGYGGGRGRGTAWSRQRGRSRERREWFVPNRGDGRQPQGFGKGVGQISSTSGANFGTNAAPLQTRPLINNVPQQTTGPSFFQQ